jgi:hypothetical protein
MTSLAVFKVGIFLPIFENLPGISQRLQKVHNGSLALI